LICVYDGLVLDSGLGLDNDLVLDSEIVLDDELVLDDKQTGTGLCRQLSRRNRRLLFQYSILFFYLVLNLHILLH